MRDPFAAIPLRPPNLETRTDGEGLMHLRLTPPLRGGRRFIANWLGYDFTRKLVLDEHGTLFYTLVDGRHRLRDIVDRLMVQSGRSRRDVEEGVVVMTKNLMTRHMLSLNLGEETHVG